VDFFDRSFGSLLFFFFFAKGCGFHFFKFFGLFCFTHLSLRGFETCSNECSFRVLISELFCCDLLSLSPLTCGFLLFCLLFGECRSLFENGLFILFSLFVSRLLLFFCLLACCFLIYGLLTTGCFFSLSLLTSSFLLSLSFVNAGSLFLGLVLGGSFLVLLEGDLCLFSLFSALLLRLTLRCGSIESHLLVLDAIRFLMLILLEGLCSIHTSSWSRWT